MWSGPEMASTKCGAAPKIRWLHPTDSPIPEADFSILEGLRGISLSYHFRQEPTSGTQAFLTCGLQIQTNTQSQQATSATEAVMLDLTHQFTNTYVGLVRH